MEIELTTFFAGIGVGATVFFIGWVIKELAGSAIAWVGRKWRGE